MGIPLVILLNWLSIFVIASAGTVLCVRYARSRSSVGFGLIALFFGLNVVQVIGNAVTQSVYLYAFERQQIDDKTWTAPVLNVDSGLPVTLLLLLAACYLIAQKLLSAAPGSSLQHGVNVDKPLASGKLEAGI